MKAIILARVSTEDQMIEGQSIPAQIARSREYAKRKGFDVISEYQFDESSMKDRRTKFEEVIKQIENSKEKIALIVETVDRLQRSFKESVMLDEYRKKDKLEIHFIRENLVLHKDSNSSEIQRWDLAVFVAKSFVLQISDNVKRTNAFKVKNGQSPCKAITGYKNITKEDGTKDIVPDQARRHLVIRIFEMYSTGNYSVRTIQKEMKELGLTSNTKIPKPLSTSQIHGILRNPFYYGIMRVKGELYPHHHEPFKYAGKPFIFRGMIKCGDERCGCTITPESHKGHIYYSCTNSKGIHANRQYVAENDLLEPIYAVLGAIRLSEDRIREITADLKRIHESKNEFYEQAKADLLKKHDTIENKLNRLFDLRLEDENEQSITKDFFSSKLKDLKEEQAEIREKIKQYDNADEKFYITANTILNLSRMALEVFKCSEPAQKRQLANFVFQNCRLNDKKLEFMLRKPFDTIIDISKLSYTAPRAVADSNRLPGSSWAESLRIGA
jgi:DNA invertase Pin-like site-specific DNA recombinase